MRITTRYKAPNKFAPNKRAGSPRITAKVDCKHSSIHNKSYTMDISGAPTDETHRQAALALLDLLSLTGAVSKVEKEHSIGLRWDVKVLA